MQRSLPIIAEPDGSTGTAFFLSYEETTYLISAGHCLTEQPIEYDDVDGHYSCSEGGNYDELNLISFERLSSRGLLPGGDLDDITWATISLSESNVYHQDRWDVVAVELPDELLDDDCFIFNELSHLTPGDTVHLEGFPQKRGRGYNSTRKVNVRGRVTQPVIDIDFGPDRKYVEGFDFLPSSGASGGPFYDSEDALCGVYSTNYTNTAVNSLTGQQVQIEYAVYVDSTVIETLLP